MIYFDFREEEMGSLKIFISAGEPSGDLHGSNLAKALLEINPNLELSGFGGSKMLEAKCNLIFPLVDFAVMGLFQAVKAYPKFKKILNLAIDHFKATKPDVLVLIDYPGFHWHLAAAAKKLGIPVVYYVPPQIWAWASWRVNKMRRLVDLVLCNFPFEEEWFKKNNVPAKLIGHPFYDQILNQKLDQNFITEQKSKPGLAIGLLPGSRNQEVAMNFNVLFKAANLLQKKYPETRFLVAAFSEAHKTTILKKIKGTNLPIEVHTGKTPEIMSMVFACASVSGSVSLELLAAQTPSVIIFQTSAIMSVVARTLKNVPYITLVNLLAGKELFPERFGYYCSSKWVAGKLEKWIENPDSREKVADQLGTLKSATMYGGASQKGAREILDFVGNKKTQTASAA